MTRETQQKTPPSLSRRALLRGTAMSMIGLSLGHLLGAGRADAQITVPAPLNTLPAGGQLRWIDSGDRKATFYRSFFPAYSADRGVEIVYDALPWNEIGQVVPLGVRNNSAHDVFALPQNVNPADAFQQGWLQALDDHIPDFEAWKAGFPTGAFLEGINQFEGKTYGLPFTSNKRYGTHLLYNRTYMQEAGFDPEEQPLTHSQFRDAARKITQAGQGRYFGLIIGGNQLFRWVESTRNLGRMAGASAGGDSLLEADIDFRTGDFVFDSDEYIAAVELLLAINRDGSMFPGAMGLNAPQARAFMPQGAAGMILQGPWNIPGWEDENPEFDFGVSSGPVPEGRAPGKLTIGQGAALPNTMWLFSGSQNGAIAGEIFHYLGSLQGQVAWATVVGAGDPPIMPEAIEAADLSDRARRILNHFNDAIRVGPNPIVRKSGLASVLGEFVQPEISFGHTVQALVSGDMSDVAGEMKALKDRYNAALDDAFAKARANGAAVDRADLVFSNWNPDFDFGPEDY